MMNASRESQATLEVARFIASHPSPEQVIAFTASPEVVERAYALISAERERPLSDEERKELESYVLLQHLMIMAKAEAHRQLQQQAS
jgi:hypothetical protein